MKKFNREVQHGISEQKNCGEYPQENIQSVPEIELRKMDDKQAPPVGMIVPFSEWMTRHPFHLIDNGSDRNVHLGEDCVKKDTHSQNWFVGGKTEGVVFREKAEEFFFQAPFGK